MSLTRRNFLHRSTAAGASLLLSSLDSLAAENPPPFTNNRAFDLKVMGTSWGFPGTVDEFCAKAKKAGYDGIEMWWPLDAQKQTDLFAALKKHDVEFRHTPYDVESTAAAIRALDAPMEEELIELLIHPVDSDTATAEFEQLRGA